jgi:hypothetical protein
MRQPPTSLPSDTKAVYIATDMVSHSLSNAAVAIAGKMPGVAVVHGTRKWAESSGRLLRAGFAEVIKTPLPKGTQFPTKERRKFYATCFAENPAISNNELEVRIFCYAADKNYTAGDSLDPAMASSMRREFGVKFGAGPNRHATVDLTAYTAACLTYNVTPNPEVFATYGNPVTYPSAVTAAAVTADTVPTSSVPVEILAAAPPRNPTIPPPVAPAPVAAPVRAVVAEPPVVAPSSVIGNGTPSWMNDDLRVALQLVRAQFEALGIESLTLTKTSTKFRRVVIEEGDVQI